MNNDLIKLIYSSDGEISIEKKSGIYVVSTDLVSAKQRMLEKMRADIIRLKVNVTKANNSYQEAKKKLSKLK